MTTREPGEGLKQRRNCPPPTPPPDSPPPAPDSPNAGYLTCDGQGPPKPVADVRQSHMGTPEFPAPGPAPRPPGLRASGSPGPKDSQAAIP